MFLRQLRLSGLYIDGVSPKQIATINPDLKLGAVLKTMVNDNWQDRRNEIMGELYREATINSKFAHLKSLNFVSGMLEVYNKRYEISIKKFLDTGNPEDLGDLQSLKIKDYSKILEMLLKLLGQDAPQPLRVEINNNTTNNTQVNSQNLEELFKMLGSDTEK